MEPETDEKNASDIVSSKSLEKKKRIKKKYNIYIYSSLAGCCFLLPFNKIFYKITGKGTDVLFLLYYNAYNIFAINRKQERLDAYN